jgi:hypothetical protein
MLKYRIRLSGSHPTVYTMSSAMLFIEPLHVHLTSSTSKGFVDHYGFMEQVKKFEFEFATNGRFSVSSLSHLFCHGLSNCPPTYTYYCS